MDKKRLGPEEMTLMGVGLLTISLVMWLAQNDTLRFIIGFFSAAGGILLIIDAAAKRARIAPTTRFK